MKILKKSKFILLPFAVIIPSVIAISCQQQEPLNILLNNDLEKVTLVEKLTQATPKNETNPSDLTKADFVIAEINGNEFNLYIQPNDYEGEVQVLVSFKKDKITSKTRIFSFSGYKKTTKEETENSLKELLGVLTVDVGLDKSTISASQLLSSDILIKNGENLLDVTYRKNIILDANDVEGKVIVKLSLTKGVITTETRSFDPIEGFKIGKPEVKNSEQPKKDEPEKPIEVSLASIKAEVGQIIGIPNVNKVDETIKSLYEKYAEVKTKNETDYSQIKNSPLASWAYAVELNKKDATAEKSKNVVKAILDRVESKTESKLDGILTLSLENLRIVATAIKENVEVNNIKIEQLKTMYKEIIEDVLTNYYYGTKTKNDNLVENQKVHKNWYFYEAHEGISSMPAQLSDLMFRGREFLDLKIKQKYRNAIDYFIPDISKIWASDKLRYEVTTPYTSKINDKVDRVLQYFGYKALASQMAEDQELFKKTLLQFKTWFETTEINPKVKNNPWSHVDKTETTETITIKDAKLRVSLDKLRHIANAISKSTNKTFAKRLQDALAKFIIWTTKDFLVNDVNATNVVQTSKERLQILAILLRTAPAIGGTEGNTLISKIKEILNGKETANVTNLATIWGWAKTELEKYLVKSTIEPKSEEPSPETSPSDGGSSSTGTDTSVEPNGEDTTSTSTDSDTSDSDSDTSGSDTSGSDTSGSDTSGSDTSGSDTSGSDTSGSDTSGSDTTEVPKEPSGVNPPKMEEPDTNTPPKEPALETKPTEPEITVNFASAKTDIGQAINVLNVNKNDTAIKTLYNKYKEVKEKTDSEYESIKNSSLASLAFAVEATKTGTNDETAKTTIKSILNKTESKTESKLDGILTSSLENLRMIATAIAGNVNINEITVEQLKTMYKEIIEDILTNYYYGTKTNSDSTTENQKVYKNWYFYESHEGKNSMLSQLSDLVYRGQDFLEEATKEKYQKALEYFIPDISKIWSKDKSRYIVNSPYTSKTNDKADRVLQYFAYKTLAAQINNDQELFKKNLEQLKLWFEAIEVQPKVKGNAWANAVTSETTSVVTIKDLLLLNSLNKTRFVTTIISKITGATYTKQSQATFKKLFDWLTTKYLVDDVTSENIASANKEVLNILGITLRLAATVGGNDGTALINKIKEILNSKTKAQITNFSSTWGWVKTELEKHLATS